MNASFGFINGSTSASTAVRGNLGGLRSFETSTSAPSSSSSATAALRRRTSATRAEKGARVAAGFAVHDCSQPGPK